MNENDQKDVDLNNDVELETEETVEEVPETVVEPREKKKFSPEEQLAIHERKAKKLRKDLGLETESKETKSTPPSDLGEKAYLIANGIKEADEMALARKLAKETGKDIESLLQTTYFQTELSTFRTQKATPTGNKRANNSSVDSVDYWIAKGELPPTSEVELRRQVVNARMKKEEAKGQFYNS